LALTELRRTLAPVVQVERSMGLIFSLIADPIVAGSIGVVAGFLLKVALERFKVTQAWRYQLVQRRLDLARRILRILPGLEITHAEFRAASANNVNTDLFMQKFIARRESAIELEQAVSEAKVLHPGPVAETMEKVQKVIDSFGSQPEKLDGQRIRSEIDTLHSTINDARGVIETNLRDLISKHSRMFG
jgi:hypothetical protein